MSRGCAISAHPLFQPAPPCGTSLAADCGGLARYVVTELPPTLSAFCMTPILKLSRPTCGSPICGAGCGLLPMVFGKIQLAPSWRAASAPGWNTCGVPSCRFGATPTPLQPVVPGWCYPVVCCVLEREGKKTKSKQRKERAPSWLPCFGRRMYVCLC